jgi:hypothetical protein
MRYTEIFLMTPCPILFLTSKIENAILDMFTEHITNITYITE